MKYINVLCVVCSIAFGTQMIVGATYRPLNMVVNEGVAASELPDTTNTSIDVDSDQPGSLKILGQRYRLSHPNSFCTVTDRIWTEEYHVGLNKRILLVKDQNEGLIEIVYVVFGKFYCVFVPEAEKSVAVSYIPPVMIKKIEFANLKKNGKVIDPYGAEITGKYVKVLSARTEYNTLSSDSVQLQVKIFDPSGKLMKNKKSPDDYTYCVTLPPGNGTETTIGTLGKWSDAFEKGRYRFEVYSKDVLLNRTTIYMQYRIDYEPVFPQGAGILRTRKEALMYSGPEYYRKLDRQIDGRTGIFIQGGGVLTGWREVRR